MSSATSVTVDWLSFTIAWGSRRLPVTYKHRSHAALANVVSGYVGLWKQGKGFKGYTVGLDSADREGLSVYLHPARPDMGIHVSYSGRALRGLDIAHLLTFVHEAGASVTRIDIAVDVLEAWDIRELKRAADAREWKCNVRKKPVLLDGEGLTLYVGSRSSEKFLRIYDKQAESGTPFAWTRVEMECKAEFARGVAGYLAQNGFKRIPDMIRGFCDFPENEAWSEAMHTTSPTLSIPKAERHTNTQQWLLTSVLPSLVKQLMTDDEFALNWVVAQQTHMDAYGRVGEVDIFDGKGDFDYDHE